MSIKTLLPLFLLALLSSCSKTIYDNVWQSKPVTVDGNSKEWEIPLRFYDSKSKLQYIVTNDSSNMYVCIRVTDERLQAKIMNAGMSVWIDTTGKNKQQVGITFPLGSSERSKSK